MDLKPWQLITTCTNCGNDFVTTKYKVNDNNNGNVFCSRKCYNEFRKKYYIKDKASVYKKIEFSCSNCNKTFLIPPNKLNNKNAYDETHIFCCKECYYQFRRNYYTGDRLYNTGIKMSDEFCEKVRQNTLKQYETGTLNRQTKPQKIVNNMLDDLNIKYTNEKIIGYYAIDNYLDEYNLMIEVMGDYFHSNPYKYNLKDLDSIQSKDKIRDMRKHTYIKKYCDVEILYLWESEINHNSELCKKLIKNYVDNNGKLNDYNSFNFFIYSDNIKLKEQILNPYFIKNP